MPGHFLEIPVFLGGYFIMPHPVYKKTKVLYFTHLPRSPPWTDFYQIWYTASSRGRNHECKIFLSIGLGVLIL